MRFFSFFLHLFDKIVDLFLFCLTLTFSKLSYLSMADLFENGKPHDYLFHDNIASILNNV